MSKFVIKKGLDIPIAGVPKQVISEVKLPKTVAILGADYNGLKPKMLVNNEVTKQC